VADEAAADEPRFQTEGDILLDGHAVEEFHALKRTAEPQPGPFRRVLIGHVGPEEADDPCVGDSSPLQALKVVVFPRHWGRSGR